MHNFVKVHAITKEIKMEREHANFNKIKFTEEKLLTHTIIVLQCMTVAPLQYALT